jgi:hypothetical protein
VTELAEGAEINGFFISTVAFDRIAHRYAAHGLTYLIKKEERKN